MAKPLRLLICEDKDDDALLEVEELREWGFDPDYQRVDNAPDLELALKAGPWEAILADYNMPSFTGMDALRIVRSEGLDIPFLLVSGTVGEDRAVDAMKAGAHDYIMKGNLARLGPAVERELREAQMREERRQALEALQKAHDELEGRVQERTAELRDVNAALQAEAIKRQKAKEELRQANELLEQRVAERTAELAQSVDALEEEVLERELTEDELRQALEEVREKDSILIQQSRLAAMGEMIGNIAHQWRQPLNSLGLKVQQLLLFYDLGELSRDFLHKNEKESMKLIQHMSQTIDDFRNYFKPDKEKTEFKVHEAVARTLLLIEDSYINQHIRVEVDLQNDCVIYGYENEFAQVLLNILVNARDVFTEREVDDPRVMIHIGKDGNKALLTISDNAGGVPEEIMGKIFDPYFTTKGPQTGTGVGLFMSKAIIEKNMGGSLSVRNTCDGAEFRIEV
ncbi:MAG: hypothetical protein A2075_01540 [Geobacteraceae bacterium GWC2_58_44]|nr:MAG: hypothetical protein A2075_01540 [Geobacteraceae bacterium GWC2_58_44]HBG08306.1 hybrid sensor histidine kinase/response regulator [Geobacter sp.]